MEAEVGIEEGGGVMSVMDVVDVIAKKDQEIAGLKKELEVERAKVAQGKADLLHLMKELGKARNMLRETGLI